MPWKQLNILVSNEQVDIISDYLESHGALAVSIKGDEDEDLFQEALNETPLWTKNFLQALFPTEENVALIIANLEKELQAMLDFNLTSVADQDWITSTQKNFPPLSFADRLWIVPSWCDAADLSGTIVRLDPGLGFGTGAHPTTALCILELLKLDLKNKVIIDYGCGSGILGLVALALGAQKVYAVDHDPQALIATQNNAALNHFTAAEIATFLPEELPKLKADFVLANILANPLRQLAPQLMDLLATDGVIILSGFLSTDLEKLTAIYTPTLKIKTCAAKEDWQCLVLRRN